MFNQIVYPTKKCRASKTTNKNKSPIKPCLFE